MPTISTYVEVDMDDLDTDDLIEELEDRGYKVLKQNYSDLDFDEEELLKVFDLWNRGDRQESMILLERIFPSLRDISLIVK